eukprot:jgi/Tetstr1/454733/TSEL_041619.t1
MTLRGVQPQIGGEAGQQVARGLVGEVVRTMVVRLCALLLALGLLVAALRPVPLKELPDFDEMAGQKALAELIHVPAQYNRTGLWGSGARGQDVPGHAIHMAMVLSNSDEDFPSVYLGVPAEPRLSEAGMLEAFRLGAALRETLLGEQLLDVEPSAVEAVARSTQDGRAIDTANAFLLGLLPINLRAMWQQRGAHADCSCRADPPEIRLPNKYGRTGWGLRADVLGRHSATPVRCLARCIGLHTVFDHDKETAIQDEVVQPAALQVEAAGLDVVMRQFDTCKRGQKALHKAIASQPWIWAENHEFKEVMQRIRNLRISELCVAATGMPKCLRMELMDAASMYDVVRSHLVNTNLWAKDPGIDRKALSYDLFLVAEWVQRRLFAPETGSLVGGMLLGDILQHLHRQLVTMDPRYTRTVVHWGAFSAGERNFAKWSKLLLHQEYRAKADLGSSRLHLYSGHRWQVLALLAALGAPEALPLPEPLGRVSITLRSTQGDVKEIKSSGLDADKLLVQLEYCINPKQCGPLDIEACPDGVCAWRSFQHALLVKSRATHNPNQADISGAWSQEMNPEGCALLARPPPPPSPPPPPPSPPPPSPPPPPPNAPHAPPLPKRKGRHGR